MKKGFSLTELVIIAAIIGILAALTVPLLQSHTTEAKEAVAKDHLRMLRSQIELYAAQHGSTPPGYKNDDTSNAPSSQVFRTQMTQQGEYLRKIPKNPFNDLDTMQVLDDNDSFPQEPSGEYGWIYQPATWTIKLDWPGTDKHGLDYFHY